MVSLLASFVLSFSPPDVLDGIWDVIESVSEGFLTYSCEFAVNFFFELQLSKIVPNFCFVLISALSVRFLTGRFIGEYHSDIGKNMHVRVSVEVCHGLNY